MKEYSVSNMLVERRSEPGKQVDQRYSVIFSVDGSNFPYQLKILHKAIKSEAPLLTIKALILENNRTC